MSSGPALDSPLLRLEGVHKTLGGQTVLRGLTLEVRRGEVYGLLGPNGSGKSTAIRLVAGLLEPDSGLVRIGERSAAEAAPRRLGLCPQDISLYRDLSVAENLAFFARLHGLGAARRRDRVDQLLEMLHFGPHAGTRVAQLSGGWQQRANLAAALVHGPDLLVLDEPTSAVDVEARHELWSLIEGLARGGLTLLLTTHQIDEAERLCSRVGLLQDGRLAAEGTPAGLVGAVPGRALAFIEPADAPGLAERAAHLGWPLRRYAGRLAALLPQPLALRAVVEALDGVAVSSVALQDVRLEHAYLEVLRGAGEAAALLSPPGRRT
jgi:ABC-2 type transport system ATP-binding protein